jgi:hypothetical protein
MAEKRKAILLRISGELADALQRWAGDELRSLNAQIEYILRDAVRKRRGKRDVPEEDTDSNKKQKRKQDE